MIPADCTFTSGSSIHRPVGIRDVSSLPFLINALPNSRCSLPIRPMMPNSFGVHDLLTLFGRQRDFVVLEFFELTFAGYLDELVYDELVHGDNIVIIFHFTV